MPCKSFGRNELRGVRGDNSCRSNHTASRQAGGGSDNKNPSEGWCRKKGQAQYMLRSGCDGPCFWLRWVGAGRPAVDSQQRAQRPLKWRKKVEGVHP